MSVADAPPPSLRHHRPFALYWVSRGSSMIALQMQAVAVAWQLYDITHNPLDLGLVGLTQFIPAGAVRSGCRSCRRPLRPAQDRPYLPDHLGARRGDARHRHGRRLADT